MIILDIAIALFGLVFIAFMAIILVIFLILLNKASSVKRTDILSPWDFEKMAKNNSEPLTYQTTESDFDDQNYEEDIPNCFSNEDDNDYDSITNYINDPYCGYEYKI